MTLFGEPMPFPGQDPWVVPFEDSLLLVQSVANNRRVAVRRFDDLAHTSTFHETVVWSPPRGSDHGHQLWAPELHCIGGRWYLYYAASDGRTRNHRSYALVADHPLGPYQELGKVFDRRHDAWSIDLTVFEHDHRLIAVWSGWSDNGNDGTQNLYLAPMSDPWTLAGERRLLARPEHGWELSVAPVNEGPQILRNPHTGQIFILYSADASWTQAYKMGFLEWTGGDVADPRAWRKLSWPILTGGGHGCVVDTREGTYLVYHRKLTSDHGWADRTVRYEPLTWDTSGYPVVGGVQPTRPTLRPVAAQECRDAQFARPVTPADRDAV